MKTVPEKIGDRFMFPSDIVLKLTGEKNEMDQTGLLVVAKNALGVGSDQ